MKIKKVYACSKNTQNEFPDLIFFEADDAVYFDATNLIEKAELTVSHSVDDFRNKSVIWERAFVQSYNLPAEEMFVLNVDNAHILIEESFTWLFLAYLHPRFAVYMNERISELHSTGMVLHDAVLISMISGRFSKEDVMNFYLAIDNEKK